MQTINISSIRGGGKQFNEACELERRMEYLNGTGLPLIIGLRDGMLYRLKPLTRVDNEHKGHLIVRVMTMVKDDIEMSHASMFCSRDEDDIQNTCHGSYGSGTIYSVLDYYLTRGALSDNGGEVYLSELDITVSSNVFANCSPHPYSRTAGINNLPEPSISGAGMSIVIVDNDRTVRERYTSLGGVPYKVPIVEDRRLSNGVYITHNNLSKGQGITIPVCTKMSSLDDHCPTNLKLSPPIYRSWEEAKYGGDSALKDKEIERKYKQRELELKNRKLELESELTEMSSAMDIMKRKHEELLLSKKNEMAEKENQLKIKQMEIKSTHDETLYSRKNFSEGMKIVPVAVTALAGLYGLYRKFS